MRIRRNAAKLYLGSASSLYSNHWSLPPATATTAAAASADDSEDGLLVKCELNCSPWDLDLLMPADSFPSCDDLNSLVSNPKEDEDRGILGHSIETNLEEEEPISSLTSTGNQPSIRATAATTNEIKEVSKTGMRNSSSKGKDKASEGGAIYCKKSDGKGWQCRRLADLPHTLCSHHIAQVRSYTTNYNHGKANDAAASAATTTTLPDHGKKRPSKAAAAVATEAIGGVVDSGFYYYYEGFGPWRGKRRGTDKSVGGDGAAAAAAAVNSEVNREDSTSGKESKSMGCNDDSIVAGDDECDLDRYLDEDDGDDDDEDGEFSAAQHNDLKKVGNEHEEKKIVNVKKKNKRGRKRVKARSLKSLL